MSDTITTLLSFLNTPLYSGDEIFEKFAALPGAVIGKGSAPLARYVYIPGTRKDRIVLVAHIDTVWDKSYNKPFTDEQTVVLEDGIFRGTNSDCGIGADCRAGCAMLWALLDCGHSILITDGEERGKHGANYLKKSAKKLYAELNRHQFMIELDWKGTDCCLFNQVDNTANFKAYIENDFGFKDSKARGGTDIGVLCSRICGVNLGIGYHGYHTNQETLVLSEWENTLTKLQAFLAKEQPRFPSLFFPKYIRFAKRCVKKALKVLKIR